MRHFALNKVLPCVLVSLLSACGGSGGGDDSSSDANLPDLTPSEYAGTFKDANQTGIFYNNTNAPQNFGWNGEHCANNANSRYYETDNALIYGQESLPESDFTQAAQWVETGLKAATSAFTISNSEYFDSRQRYSPLVVNAFLSMASGSIEKQRVFNPHIYVYAEMVSAGTLTEQDKSYVEGQLRALVYINNSGVNSYHSELLALLPQNYASLSQDEQLLSIVDGINQIASDESELAVTSEYLVNMTLPNDFDLWADRSYFQPMESRDSRPLENYLYAEFVKLSRAEQEAALAHFNAKLPYVSSIDEAIYQDKIYVCLTNNNSNIGWGEGTNLGISFSAPSVFSRQNPQQVVVHELIHTIQMAYTSSPYTFSHLPRWLLEGQAVYLSGQTVASKSQHANYEPLSVNSFSDEYGDASEAYQHYGLAYSYIHENSGLANIKGLFSAMHGKYSGESFSTNYSWVFAQSFANYMQDHHQQALDYTRYASDYHTLIGTW
ncbi:hypothetical protein [Litorilituus sediminis]|uniref:Uncharacterized protein n=1 Tax=Litorilituus sediminis TaxID=718192 RepID=A0A4P6P754_9GAMM|nr:hypothetical protein [Litorilituus sediminis]QBG36878.1 hypothetical protein EMK97_14690 [Litorilituus sediminis]